MNVGRMWSGCVYSGIKEIFYGKEEGLLLMRI
jgi:hypothetical protein